LRFAESRDLSITEALLGGCVNAFRHDFDAECEAVSAPAEDSARAGRIARKFVTRWIPGGVAIVAALTLPDMSVGAGDLGGGEGREPLPAPSARRGVKAGGPTQPLAAGPLGGVRYVGLLALGESSARAAPVAPAITSVPPLGRSAGTARIPDLAPSVPVIEAEAFAPPAPSAPLTPSPVAVAPVVVPEAIPPAAAITAPPQPATPLAAVAAAVFPVPPEAPPTVRPDLPAVTAPVSAPLAALESPALAAFQPEERAALAVPLTAAAAVPIASAFTPLPVQTSVAAQPATLAATAPGVKPPVGRRGIEQIARAGPVPQQLAPPAPAAAQPTPSVPAPSKAALAVVPSVVAAAGPARPGARPPVAGSAPVAAPARAASPPAPTAVPAPTPAIAAVPRAPAPLAAAPGLGSAKPAFRFDIKSQLVTRVDGKTAGAVDFRQTETGLAVRIGSIAEVLADRFDPAQLARIRGSHDGNTWLSLAELRAQGIPISYDPVYDEFNVGHVDPRPKAGRKVHMDQITAPARGIGATGIDQVRR